MTLEKFYEHYIVSFISYRVLEYFFNTYSYVIYRQSVTIGKCFESGIVSLVSYRVSRVFHSALFLYNL